MSKTTETTTAVTTPDAVKAAPSTPTASSKRVSSKVEADTLANDFLMNRLYRSKNDTTGYKTTKLVHSVKAYCDAFDIDYGTLTVSQLRLIDRDWLLGLDSFGTNTMTFLENSMKNAGYRMPATPTLGDILSMDVFMYNDNTSFVFANDDEILGAGATIEDAVTEYRASLVRGHGFAE